MKNSSITYITFFIIMCFSNSYGQMINQGSLYISNNTEVSVYENIDNEESAILNNNGQLHVFKNLENKGKVKFESTTLSGTTFLVGSQDQYISGDGNYDLLDLEINNSSSATFSISLESRLNIFGVTYFEEGRVNKLNEGLLNFQNNGESFDVKNNSYANNKAQKTGNNEFTFPIGNFREEKYLFRPLKISAPEKETDMFYAEYNWTETNTSFKHTNKDETLSIINPMEYWVLERKKGDSEVDLTLCWNEITTPSIFLDEIENMVIVRWNGDKWINEGGIIDTETKEIKTKISGFGVFTFGLLNSKTKESIVDIKKITNSFSPNNDGINDGFEIPGLVDVYPNFKITIYNRYGNVIYDYKNQGKLNPEWWDGKSYGRMTIGGNQQLVPSGTYYYIVDFNDGKTNPYQGWVYLKY